MFIPNTQGLLSSQAGTNLYGEPDFLEPRTVPCGVVKLNRIVQKTSVRADSSGSRGNSDEFVSQAKILFLPSSEVRTGDKFEIHGMMLRAIKVHPRISISGILEHYEVDFEAWT